jgi:hypothetical protein
LSLFGKFIGLSHIEIMFREETLDDPMAGAFQLLQSNSGETESPVVQCKEATPPPLSPRGKRRPEICTPRKNRITQSRVSTPSFKGLGETEIVAPNPPTSNRMIDLEICAIGSNLEICDRFDFVLGENDTFELVANKLVKTKTYDKKKLVLSYKGAKLSLWATPKQLQMSVYEMLRKFKIKYAKTFIASLFRC